MRIVWLRKFRSIRLNENEICTCIVKVRKDIVKALRTNSVCSMSSVSKSASLLSVLLALSLFGAGLAISSVSFCAPGQAKKMTVYDRQVALKKEIDAGEKSKELTLKEASKLREKLESINEKKEKMLAKNGGKLSYKDEEKMEKWLNGVSIDIQKKRLAKRVR